jgi:hypothetical protein
MDKQGANTFKSKLKFKQACKHNWKSNHGDRHHKQLTTLDTESYDPWRHNYSGFSQNLHTGLCNIWLHHIGTKHFNQV